MQVDVEDVLERCFSVRQEQVDPLAPHPDRRIAPTTRIVTRNRFAPSSSARSARNAECRRGRTSACPRLTGSIVRIASARSSPYTTPAGPSPATIRQETQPRGSMLVPWVSFDPSKIPAPFPRPSAAGRA